MARAIRRHALGGAVAPAAWSECYSFAPKCTQHGCLRDVEFCGDRPRADSTRIQLNDATGQVLTDPRPTLTPGQLRLWVRRLKFKGVGTRLTQDNHVLA